MAQTILSNTFKRFPSLLPEMQEVVSKVIIREREKTKEIIEATIDAEESYVFTNDTN